MSVSVSQILAAARRNPELMTSETAAYIVLSLVEQSLSGPRSVGVEQVLLHQGGAITMAEAPVCSNAENDACLRLILKNLLDAAKTATSSEALAVITAGRPHSPGVLRADLHNALVPLNRAAARRALARLYRKVAGSAPEGEDLPPASVSEHDSSPISRRSRRRPSAAEEIHVAVDETAFRVASTLSSATFDSPPQATRLAGDEDARSVNWHPAQTTPWQFRDVAVAGAADGTPILGSLLVRERPLELVQRPPQTDFERSSAALPLTSVSQLLPPTSPASEDDWADTCVDAPVMNTRPDEPVVAPSGRHRSRVSQLVERMPSPALHVLDDARSSLLQMVNEAGEEPEFLGLGTVTPPPVSQASTVQVTPSAKRGPRRIVLSMFAAGVAGFGVWLQLLSSAGTESPLVAPASSTDCVVQVNVEVPNNARVFLNDAKERRAQDGPTAQFAGVGCASQAEVTVHLPSPAGSPLPDAWVRVPLPEAELRKAAEGGQPFRITPLGEVR